VKSDNTYVPGSVYVIGGTDGTGAQTSVYQIPVAYDGLLGTPSTVASLTTARRGHSAIVSQGQICVIGGLGAANMPITSVECATVSTADGTLGAWATVQDTTPTTVALSTARAYAPAAIVGNQIEVFAGQGPSGDVQSIDQAGLGPS